MYHNLRRLRLGFLKSVLHGTLDLTIFSCRYKAFTIYILSMEPDHKLYEKMLDMKIVLRDVQDRFRPYSATDIKALINSKMKSKREPLALQHLYKLELMIADLRTSLLDAKEAQDFPTS